ncbi:MAG: RNA pseudouridine synthase [Cellvibrionales bacterium]|nr:RNA pseudouridine synthase [Cellvibrionales bacterium]
MNIEKKIPITSNGKRAIDWLAENSPLSRMQLKKALANGAVWLHTGKKQERLRRATRELPANSTLHMYYDAAILALEPPTPTLVCDENQYSVWYKPAGLLSQGSKQGDHCSLLRIVEQTMNRKTFLVHRLDREANGLMLVAHTEKAAAALSGLFQKNRIDKYYAPGRWRMETSRPVTRETLPFENSRTWMENTLSPGSTCQLRCRQQPDTLAPPHRYRAQTPDTPPPCRTRPSGYR